ncbi:MAG: LarC family nickel insertion protein [Halopseudomonas sp.]
MKHIHLDVVGGMAGDMFCAAMLDAFPDYRDELVNRLNLLKISPQPDVEITPFNDGVLQGHQFKVLIEEQPGLSCKHQHQHQHQHRHWQDIRHFLEDAPLEPQVKEHALGIFLLLAEAEAEVHGVKLETVQFHEVGNWDSIIDIVAAAFLIHWTDVADWSVSKLPIGKGQVLTAHGRLPIPAPATRRLLRGFDVFDDGLEGERITPTGAAILKYLKPSVKLPEGRMAESGYGHGHKVFPGISNVLCVQVIELQKESLGDERLVVVECEIDDQTPEDLAVALEILRSGSGIKDAQLSTSYGKKGRLSFSLQLLVLPAAKDTAIQMLFDQTSTIGVRWFPIQRRLLKRSVDSISGNRVKYAQRGGVTTVKAEMDDIARVTESQDARERLRRHIEGKALEENRDA